VYKAAKRDFCEKRSCFVRSCFSDRPAPNLVQRLVVAMARKVAHRCRRLILLARQNVPIEARQCKRFLSTLLTARRGNCPATEETDTTDEQPVVFIIDDDEPVRETVADLLRSVGLGAQAFGPTQEFMRAKRPNAPGCIVLDVRLPGASDLEFQRTF